MNVTEVKEIICIILAVVVQLNCECSFLCPFACRVEKERLVAVKSYILFINLVREIIFLNFILVVMSSVRIVCKS